MNNVEFRIISYQLLTESSLHGNSFLYASNIDELENLIKTNERYRIVFVCKMEHVPQLHHILNENCIIEILIFGNEIELNISNKKVTMVNTDEQDLKFQILCTAIRYTREQQVEQQQMGNQSLANQSATDILALLSQLETLTKNSVQQ